MKNKYAPCHRPAISYDALGRLTSLNPGWGAFTTYSYDYQNRLVSRADAIVNGWNVTHYSYDGTNISGAFDANGHLLESFIWDPTKQGGVGGLLWIITYNADGTEQARYHPFYNAHGDVMGLTDANGNVVATYTYSAYGTLTSRTWNGPAGTSDPNLFFWQTAYLDPTTGFYWMKARWYSPQLGRFITRDPSGEVGGDDLYEYGGNDPEDNNDPSGLQFNTTTVPSSVPTTITTVEQLGRQNLGELPSTIPVDLAAVSADRLNRIQQLTKQQQSVLADPAFDPFSPAGQQQMQEANAEILHQVNEYQSEQRTLQQTADEDAFQASIQAARAQGDAHLEDLLWKIRAATPSDREDAIRDLEQYESHNAPDLVVGVIATAIALILPSEAQANNLMGAFPPDAGVVQSAEAVGAELKTIGAEANAMASTSERMAASVRAGTSVGSGLIGDIQSASFVRQIARGERVADLADELKTLTFRSRTENLPLGLEHGIVSLNDGTRWIIRGGEAGIDLGSIDNLDRLIVHTHGIPTGASAADVWYLMNSGQWSTRIIEIGNADIIKLQLGR